MWKTKCRSRSDVEFFMGGDDSDWDHLRCIYGQNTGDYGRCPRLIKEAVTLCITMIGVMAFWMGLMEIASKAGMIEKGAKMLKPFVRFLFPEVPEGHKAGEHITTNIIANFLGLGWAATPAGLKAMEELGKLNHGSPVASNAMCNFLILNISSLQLIPVNVIAFRSQYGSVNPTAIVGAGIVATAISTGTAIVFCKIMDRKKTRRM